MLRAIPLLSVLALLLSSPSQAALVSAAPASLPPATSENASTAFLEGRLESRIGLLCHNDPINNTDPDGQMPLSKLTVKGIEKFLKTKTAHQLIAKGKNLIAGSKKEAVRAVEKSKPDSKAVFHTKDSTSQKIGPHAQPKPRDGNTTHVFDKSRTNMSALRNAAGAVTAGAYLGADSPAAQVIDFFNPLSIGQDIFDVVDAFSEAAHQVDTEAPAHPGQ